MIWKNCKFWIFLLSFIMQGVTAQYSPAVSQFIQSNSQKNAQHSIYAVNLTTGETLDAHAYKMALIPASNVKLFTTALAWEILGPDFKFETKVYTIGQINEEGTLSGNLLVEGAGDPTLGSEKWPERSVDAFFDQITLRLKEKGIRSISGEVILHTAPWKGEWHNRDWPWADLGNYYAISSGAVNVFENKYELTFNTTGKIGSEAAILDVQPELDLIFDNQVVIGPPYSGDQAYIFGDAHDKNRIIRGSVPKRGSRFQIKGSLPNPEAYFTKRLYQKLGSEGIEMAGGWKIDRGAALKEAKLLLSYTSPPLQEIVDYINAESHNLFAEALYKYVELKHPFLLDAQKKEWGNSGLAFDRIRWKDGCGLSPFNRFSAKDFVQLLKIMAGEKEFLNSLASHGKKGTLQYRFRDIPTLQAKTGSIEGVYALSGIFKNREGQMIAFSIIINNFYGSSRTADVETEKLLQSWAN